MKIINTGFLFFFLFTIHWIIAQDTLHINRGSFFISPYEVHKISINNSINFEKENAIYEVAVNGNLGIVFHNNDTVIHTLTSPLINDVILQPNQYITINVSNISFGTHLLWLKESVGEFLGAGLIVKSGIPNQNSYVWDLWDQSPDLAEDMYNGIEHEIPAVYRPTFFSINGGVDPMDMMAGAMVMGNVGDSIYISITNSGNMIHPLHFHGYHVEIIQSTLAPNSIGWSKDSFPVFVKDAMTVLLVPHQPGDFPVHNHNLVATLFNNGYPLGMATMLMIQP